MVLAAHVVRQDAPYRTDWRMLVRYPFMLTNSEIRARALAHIKANPLPDAEYRYVMREPVELPHGWFFWYAFEHVGDLPPDKWQAFIGPAGFVVSKSTGEIQVMTLVPNGVTGATRKWWRFW